MFAIYLTLGYTFNEIFNRPKENTRRCHVWSIHLLFTLLFFAAGIGAGMFLGTYHRYGLTVVILLIGVSYACKKLPSTRLVTIITVEFFVGIILCLFIKIFIGVKVKYPGLPIGTLFFLYEKFLSRLFFLVLCQGLKCDLNVQSVIATVTYLLKMLSFPVLFIDIIFQDTVLY